MSLVDDNLNVKLGMERAVCFFTHVATGFRAYPILHCLLRIIYRHRAVSQSGLFKLFGLHAVII